MKWEELMKKMPLKNYLIYAVLVVVTMMIVFFLGNLFKENSKFTKEKSILNDVLSSVQLNEMESFILEHPNFLLVVSDYSDGSKNAEKLLKGIILEYHLEDDMFYFEYDHPKRVEQLMERYHIESSVPMILSFSEGNYKTSFTTFQKENLTQFLKNEGVIE